MASKIDMDSVDENLTVEQIEELLRDAERRLKGEQVASHQQNAAQSQQK